MKCKIKPEVSKKRSYWLPKHRYYELRYFCLQYPTWKKAYLSLDGLSKRPQDLEVFAKSHGVSDPTSTCAISRERFLSKMKMVEQAAIKTDSELSDYILKGVTEGLGYDDLKVSLDIPCSKDTYYNRYRKFFWLLSRERD